MRIAPARHQLGHRDAIRRQRALRQQAETPRHFPSRQAVDLSLIHISTDIAALVAERAFSALRAPIRRVTAPHTPVPFSDALEDLYIPDAAKIEAAVRQALEGRDAA